jgi:sugar lactone lactonase YvrE
MKILVSICRWIVLCVLLFAPIPAQSAPGDLYIANVISGTISQVKPDGTKTEFASGLVTPIGAAFDKQGTLFVGDADSSTDNNSIYAFAADGLRSTFATDLNSPFGLAFDSSGSLFVAGADTGVVTKITSAGAKTEFASGLASPFGLAFDTVGNLFVSDEGRGRMIKITPAGAQSTFASGLGGPIGLAFDGAGNLFVSDPSSQVICKLTPSGEKTVAFSDIDATTIAFDTAGNLFVSEFSENKVEKITPAGTRTTFVSELSGPYFMAFEPITEKLRNISTRGFVQTGDSVLIGGFIVGGSALANNAVLLRAIGPSLAASGVPDPLLDPTLEIHDVTGAVIATNDDWQDTQSAQIEATGLTPGDPMESAIFATLPAGAYTAIVRGAGDTTGNALFEVYSVN